MSKIGKFTVFLYLYLPYPSFAQNLWLGHILNRAKIGLDIKDMFDKLNLNDMAGAKLIYETVRFCVLRIFVMR